MVEFKQKIGNQGPMWLVVPQYGSSLMLVLEWLSLNNGSVKKVEHYSDEYGEGEFWLLLARVKPSQHEKLRQYVLGNL